MSERVSEIQKLLDSAELSEETKTGLEEEAKAVADEIEEVREELGRANRLGFASRAIDRATARPTEDQMWLIERTWEEAPAVIERVNALLTVTVPALETRLAEEGVRPEIGEAIEIPARP